MIFKGRPFTSSRRWSTFSLRTLLSARCSARNSFTSSRRWSIRLFCWFHRKTRTVTPTPARRPGRQPPQPRSSAFGKQPASGVPGRRPPRRGRHQRSSAFGKQPASGGPADGNSLPTGTAARGAQPYGTARPTTHLNDGGGLEPESGGYCGLRRCLCNQKLGDTACKGFRIPLETLNQSVCNSCRTTVCVFCPATDYLV